MKIWKFLLLQATEICIVLQPKLAQANWYTNIGLINQSVFQWETQRPSGKERALRLGSFWLALESLRESNIGCYLLLKYALGHVPWTHLLSLGESCNTNKSKISILLKLSNFVDRAMSFEILSQNVTQRGRERFYLCLLWTCWWLCILGVQCPLGVLHTGAMLRVRSEPSGKWQVVVQSLVLDCGSGLSKQCSNDGFSCKYGITKYLAMQWASGSLI